MKIIRDSDTVTIKDESGDALVLLTAPKYRDVLACEELERTEAIAALDRLKAAGVDIDAELAEAEADPDKMKAAQKAAAEAPDSPAVRRYKLGALAVALIVGGERIGGRAVLDAYDDMTRDSAEWVDQEVRAVWDSASLDDRDTRSAAPNADGASVPAGSSPA